MFVLMSTIQEYIGVLSCYVVSTYTAWDALFVFIPVLFGQALNLPFRNIIKLINIAE